MSGVNRRIAREPCSAQALCATAHEYILLKTAGGSHGSHKSFTVGGGRGAIVRGASHRASFFSAEFDSGKTVTLRGIVSKVD